MERFLRLALRHFIRAGNLRVTTAGGTSFHLRRRHRAAGRDPLHHPRRPVRRAARSRAEVRRSLYGRHARRRTGNDRRRACGRVCAAPRRQAAAVGASAMADRATSIAGCCSSIRRQRARRNVAHHYDLDGQLYALFLDSDRQYSCAYFETPDQTLDDAQLAKKRHLAAKLLLEPRRPRARHRLRLGRARRSTSPKCARRRRHRHHAVGGAARLCARARASEQPLTRARRVPAAGLPRRRRTASTASSRSACSSMSASASTTRSSANAPRCSTTTA